jgi:hypothetical protein
MKAHTAENYLPCYRVEKPMASAILKAVRVAEGDDALREKLQDQMDFDAQIVAAIQTIKPPDTLRERLKASSGEKTPALRKQVSHPAILSAIAGVLLIIGFLGYMEMDRRAGFPGKEQAERMVAMLGSMSGVELEPAHGPAGGLGDWFYMRGFEGFNLPADLTALPAVGLRTFKLNGHSVSQVAIDRHATILHVFRASDFQVRLDEDADWKVFEQEGWVAAIRQRQDLCTLLAFRGDRAEMEKFVRSLQP